MIKLKEYREILGISQLELSKKLNISQQAISAYENGAREPDIDTLNKICEFFKISLDDLIGRNEESIKKMKYKHLNNTLIGRVSSKLENMSDDELELLDKLVDKIMKEDK